MKPVALAALVSFGAWAIEPAPRGAFTAREARIDLPDGGTAQVAAADGGVTGCWMDTGTCIALARERVEMQDRVKAAESAEKQALQNPAVSVTIGLVVGLIVGGSVATLLKPTQPSP